MNVGTVGLEYLLAGVAAGSLVTWLFARARLAELRTRLEERSQAQESAIEALLERAKNEMRDATAARAGERVGDLVKPMHDQLTEFNRLIADIEKSRKFDSGQLKEAMTGLDEPNPESRARRFAAFHANLHARHGVAKSDHARALGRDAAAQRGGEGRHVAALRF